MREVDGGIRPLADDVKKRLVQERDVSARHGQDKRADTVGHSISTSHRCFHCAEFLVLLGLQLRHMRGTIVGTLRMTNSIRALTVYLERSMATTMRSYVCPVVQRGHTRRDDGCSLVWRRSVAAVRASLIASSGGTGQLLHHQALSVNRRNFGR